MRRHIKEILRAMHTLKQIAGLLKDASPEARRRAATALMHIRYFITHTWLDLINDLEEQGIEPETSLVCTESDPGECPEPPPVIPPE